MELLAPSELPTEYNVDLDDAISAWEVSHHAIRLLGSEGAGATHALIRDAAAHARTPVQPEAVKELAFLLFSIAEKNGWSKDAVAFNQLATSWADIRDAQPPVGSPQDAFDF